MREKILYLALHIFIATLFLMSFESVYSFYKIKEISRSMKKIQTEIESINYRMDTLEFFKLPEEKRKWK